MSPSSVKTGLRIAALLVMISIVATMVADCGKGDDSHSTASAPATVPPGNSVVQGIVKFTGPPPPVTVIGIACTPGASPAIDESTVVNDNGTLANVVVYIKSAPNVASTPDQLAPATIDQKDCRYWPHVLAVRTGEPIDVTSHDATMHNVHVMGTLNPEQNFSEFSVGATHRLVFAFPEPVHLKCDVHPWMSAYLFVLDHPFFAVTGKDGSFQIPRLPAGTYNLCAWQEKYGTLEQTFTVDGTNGHEIDFEYKVMENGKW